MAVAVSTPDRDTPLVPLGPKLRIGLDVELEITVVLLEGWNGGASQANANAGASPSREAASGGAAKS